MVIKMLKIMDEACESVNGALGVNVKFPKPTKKQLQATQILNVTTGATCIALGMVSPYKKISLLGGLSLAGACFIGSQLKHFD
ncbi:hypothetical protein [Anaerosphaera multitolerans]|uniref:DUF4231 domain-containing protein n=1 Tax=Anaerosphaera multitolerans TaxID=2487351 RepID=A0A437S875_9FIRM|nr:hypothetical protein [Anaerosphaera multitolerans]RVU55027.1 hypothetical protein EF514_03820 [Anaerosphaera multitolerans]